MYNEKLGDLKKKIRKKFWEFFEKNFKNVFRKKINFLKKIIKRMFSEKGEF